MFSARRVYGYLVSLVSFAAVVFAAISLLQKLLTPSPYGGSPDIALQIAILVIATPIYLGHWVWLQRKADEDEEERGAFERRIYLYALVGGAVGVAALNLFDLLQWALDVGVVDGRLRSASALQVILYYLIPVAVAAGTWFYHSQVLRRDQDDFPDTGARGSVHRIYLYLFSAVGLIMTGIALVELVRWFLSTLGDALFDAGPLDVDLVAVVPRMSVGLALWLVYWVSVQRLFRTGVGEETGSILRKFYLYAAIFVGVAGGVSTAALILSGIFRSMLGLSPDGDIRNPIALIIAFAMLWFYHSRVLNDDVQAAQETAQQNEIRRIYLYLLSAIGLCALLIGVIGDVSTLLFIVDDGISDSHREALAYFSAALIAGLPVWILAWRKAQQEVAHANKTGRQARDSVARKIYLYFFLLVSILSVLGSAIYVLYRILQWFLSGESITLVNVAIPSTIAVVLLIVWVYHLNVLRSDRRQSAEDEVRHLTDIRLALVAHGESVSLRALADRLRSAAPGLDIQLLQAGDLAHDRTEEQAAAVAELEQAEVIVAPWTLFVRNGDAAQRSLAVAVANSTAQKIVLPATDPAWRWVGLEEQTVDEIADETLKMLKSVVAGEEIRNRRRLGCGAAALIIAGAIVLVYVLTGLFGILTSGF